MNYVQQNDYPYSEEKKMQTVSAINRDGIIKTWYNHRPSEMLINVSLRIGSIVLMFAGLGLFAAVLFDFKSWAGGDPLEGVLKYNSLVTKWSAMSIISGCCLALQSVCLSLANAYSTKATSRWINLSGIDVPRFILEGAARGDKSRQFAGAKRIMYYAKNPQNNMAGPIIDFVLGTGVAVALAWVLHDDILKAAEEIMYGTGDGKLIIESFSGGTHQTLIVLMVACIAILVLLLILFFTIILLNTRTNSKIERWAQEQINNGR